MTPDPMKDVIDQLQNLCDKSHPGNSRDIWKQLNLDLADRDLDQAYLNNKKKSRDALLRFINGEVVECKIGALRAYTQLEKGEAFDTLQMVYWKPSDKYRDNAISEFKQVYDQNPSEADKNKAIAKLKKVYEKNPFDDIKGWVLYDLLLMGVPVNMKYWDEKLIPVITDAFKDPHQQVRQWAAYLLGEMGRDPQIPGRSYFEKDVCIEAEKLLLEHWFEEINLYVDRQIVISLGLVGGYNLQPRLKDGQEPNVFIKVLNEATKHENDEVRKLVPDAAASISSNVVQGSEKKPDLIPEAIAQVLRVLSNWLANKNLKDHLHHQGSPTPCTCDESSMLALTCLRKIWENASKAKIVLSDDLSLIGPDSILTTVLTTPALAYDSYRLAITTTIDIVEKSFLSSPRLAEKGIQQLLEVVDGSQPDEVRARAMDALRELAAQDDNKNLSAQDNNNTLHNKVKNLTLNKLQMMLTDPSEIVKQEVNNALIVLMDYPEGIEFFTDVVLNDQTVLLILEQDGVKPTTEKNLDEEKRQVRKQAAQGLAKIGQLYNKPKKKDKGAYWGLINALQGSKDPEHSYAREALISIGSEQGVQALVEQDARQYINQQYFGPIEKAETKSETIQDEMVNMSKISFWFTLVVASAAAIAGVALLWISINTMKSQGWEGIIPALSGLILAIAGILTPFFWNSAQAVQKTAGQMANLITGFNGYLGRMRLIGLSFANAISQNNINQNHTNFTIAMSNAVGQAIMDSSQVLESVGGSPLVATDFTSIPNFVGMSKTSAQTLATDRCLSLVDSKFENDDKAEKDIILAQDIRSNTDVKKNTTVGITISLGPNGTTSSPAK